jgi:hypothetical protein
MLRTVITTDGGYIQSETRELRRSTRGNERLEFWRQFINAADRASLPALAAHALTMCSIELRA